MIYCLIAKKYGTGNEWNTELALSKVRPRLDTLGWRLRRVKNKKILISCCIYQNLGFMMLIIL